MPRGPSLPRAIVVSCLGLEEKIASPPFTLVRSRRRRLARRDDLSIADFNRGSQRDRDGQTDRQTRTAQRIGRWKLIETVMDRQTDRDSLMDRQIETDRDTEMDRKTDRGSLTDRQR